jgi:predicted enzyme related to lactoylglutathione lyase
MGRFRYLVKDAAAAAAFYTENFGFVVELQVPPFAMVTRGDVTLLLSGPKSSAGLAMPDGRVPEAGGWNRMLIDVDDIETEVVRLRRAGVHFRNEIVDGVGGKQILAEDLDGNPIELFQPT